MYLKEFDKQQLATLRQWCGEARHVVLLSHMNADGDACGSLLGMALQLDHAAANALSISPILPNGCPRNFLWLPQAHRILSGEKERMRCEQLIAEADLIFCLDINSSSRTDFLQDALRNAKGHKVLVDHHHNPAVDEFQLIYSDPEISSTCEYVVWLSQALWGDQYFNADVARCLYTGLRTDTGGFAFSCSQPSCFEAAAKLVAFDINPADIHNHIANTFTVNRMQFYGFAISQRLEIYPSKQTALFAFSLDDQRRFGVDDEDMEGLVNYTLMMSDIQIGALLREKEGRTKISFRCKSGDVNILAQQLGGGGHTKAAGATCTMSFADTLHSVKQLLGVLNLQPVAPLSESYSHTAFHQDQDKERLSNKEK